MSSSLGDSSTATDSWHGTTNVGLKAKQFMILAGDRRVTGEKGWRRVISYDNDQKLLEISSISNIHCTAAGDVYLWDRMYAYVRAEVAIEERRTGRSTTVEFAERMIREHCDRCAREKGAWKNDHRYGGILAGWPKGGVARMYIFMVQKNKPDIDEIIVGEDPSSFVTLGSGELHAGSHMLEFRRKPLRDRQEGADRTLRAIFKAFLEDPNSGGGAQVGCLEEGVYHPMFSGDTLELYSHLFLEDKVPTIFVFVPKNMDLTEWDIRKAWSCYKVTSVYCLRCTKNFNLYCVVFLRDKELKEVKKTFSMPAEPDLEHVTSPQDFLSALTIVRINDHLCFGSNKLKSVIDVVFRFS